MTETEFPTEFDHWDRRFIELARFIAGWSKDPSTQVGAVITGDMHRIVSTGFNGLPAGVEDTVERLNDRELKYQMVVHAERNAIINARRDVSGMQIYVWPLPPCSVCASMIIQAGLHQVTAPETDNPRWVESVALSKTMFEEAGVRLRLAPAAWGE
ncbi:MAG: deoxycytidylate deaminase [Rhodospirillales bacterium]